MIIKDHMQVPEGVNAIELPKANNEIIKEIERWLEYNHITESVNYLPYRPVLNPITFEAFIHTRHPGATLWSENDKLLLLIKLKWG